MFGVGLVVSELLRVTARSRMLMILYVLVLCGAVGVPLSRIVIMIWLVHWCIAMSMLVICRACWCMFVSDLVMMRWIDGTSVCAVVWILGSIVVWIGLFCVMVPVIS